MTKYLGLFLGSVFLLVQLGMVVYAQFTPYRYFCWAPNDYATDYSLQVHIGDRELSPAEVKARYRILSASGVYQNPGIHIRDYVRQYEATYGRNDHAQVTLRWRLNGHADEHLWEWPADSGNKD